MDWDSRFPKLVSEVQSYDADILCLQEIEEPSYNTQWTPLMEAAGFSGCWSNRHTSAADQASGKVPTGVALFCRCSKLTMKTSRSLVFADVIDELMPEASGRLRSRLVGEPEEGFKAGDYNTNGEGGAVLALLERSDGGGSIVASSLHFYFDFRFNEVKTAQALMLTRAAVKMADDAGDGGAAVVICGDHNAVPEGSRSWKNFGCLSEGADPTLIIEEAGQPGGMYHFMQTGQLPAEHPDHPHAAGSWEETTPLVSALGPLRSAYRHGNGEEPEVTSRDVFVASCIDFIWLGYVNGPPINDESAAPAVAALLEMPYTLPEGAWPRTTMTKFGPIPNGDWPSDHLAIGATIAF